MPSSERAGLPTSGLRVLLIEDQIMVALVLEDMLAALGHRVLGPVTRLKTALEVVQRETIDVAILDVNIDGEEVYPVAAALANRDIPFVFATGHTRKVLRAPYRDRPFLHKPFRLRDLREVLAEARLATQH